MDWLIWLLILIPWTPIILILLVIVKKLEAIKKRCGKPPNIYIVKDDTDGDQGQVH